MLNRHHVNACTCGSLVVIGSNGERWCKCEGKPREFLTVEERCSLGTGDRIYTCNRRSFLFNPPAIHVDASVYCSARDTDSATPAPKELIDIITPPNPVK